MTDETKPNIHGLSSIYFCNETTNRGTIVVDDDEETEYEMKQIKDRLWNKYRVIADQLVEQNTKEQLELAAEKELLEYDQLHLMKLEEETARIARIYAQVREQLVAKEMERQRLKRELDAVKAHVEQIYSAKGNTGTIAKIQAPDNSSVWLKLRLLVKGKKTDKKRKSKRLDKKIFV